MSAEPLAEQPAVTHPRPTPSGLGGTTLPGPMIDLIRDGVPPHVLSREGGKAVYKALRRTAISAQLRGWTEGRWLDLVDNPYRSDLARQNGMGGGGRERSANARRKTLDAAWKSAALFLEGAEPAWSRAEAEEHARIVAAEVIGYLCDAEEVTGGAQDLLPSDADVLRVVADLAAERGSDRLTIPRQLLVDRTDWGVTAVGNALRRLDERGALVVVTPGARRVKGRKSQASIYRLRPVTLWEKPVCGAPHAVSSAPTLGAPAVSGAPHDTEDAVNSAPARCVTIEQVAEVLGAEAAATLDALVPQPDLRLLPGGLTVDADANIGGPDARGR